MKRFLKHAAALTTCLVVSYGTYFAFAEDKDRIIAEWKCFSHFGGHCHCLDGYRRNAATSLKTLASAQADFRANDRDGDGVSQFWRADVAGLYAYAPHGNDPIRLIELSVAAADDRPVANVGNYAARSAKAGYWYRALRHADEDPKALDPDRYAYCAFPVDPKKDRYMYVMDETCQIHRSPAQGKNGVRVYPTPEELRQFWSRLD